MLLGASSTHCIIICNSDLLMALNATNHLLFIVATLEDKIVVITIHMMLGVASTNRDIVLICAFLCRIHVLHRIVTPASHCA